jgi:AraC-like DNA-binding protein
VGTRRAVREQSLKPDGVTRHPESPATPPGYLEWQPRRSPAESVACVWVSRPSVWTFPHVLPDACIDIVWDGERLFVAGPDTRPVAVSQEEGVVISGVRFRPGTAPGFLNVPASELLDSRADLSDIWGNAAAERLAERLVEAGGPESAADELEAAVAERARTARLPDEVACALVSLLGHQPSSAGALRAASEELGVGPRRLHRHCCEAIGYGPKTLQRVLRFQRALRLATEERSLASLAARAGYSDQAHMSRECQRLAGLTPSVLFKTTRPTDS